jgi:general secretion pathway protein L
MLEASQNWNLFGYDLSGGLHYFRAGWRDFLWGDDSPVMDAVDEVVGVFGDNEEPEYYRAGRVLERPPEGASVEAQALMLPDRLVLPKTLTLPSLAEGNLETIVGLEVRANSPFPADDTRFGWRIISRTEKDIIVQLVICSCSAVMEYMAQKRDSHDVHAYEVWSQLGGAIVMIAGFGEVPRKERNKVRIIRLGVGLAYCLLATVVAFGLGTAMKALELQAVQKEHRIAQQRAAEAVSLRTELSDAKKRVAVVKEILAENPSHYQELSRLSALLDDKTWLSQIDINGAKIRIDGSSPDAAEVMQKLTDEPAYKSVVAPVGIKRVSTSGIERFVLDITLASVAEAP